MSASIDPCGGGGTDAVERPISALPRDTPRHAASPERLHVSALGVEASPAAARGDVRRERAIARGLLLMRDARLYRDLGFVRLADYVVERMGCAFRAAEDLMRTEESLRRLPLTSAALDGGEISAAHVRLLIQVADASSEAFWLGLAARRGVRELGAAVDRFRRGEREERGAVEERGTAPPSREPELMRLEVHAPAWIATFWRDSVTFIRQLVGGAIPEGVCLGVVLAEMAPAIAPGDATPEALKSRVPACAPPREAPGDGDEEGQARCRPQSACDARIAREPDPGHDPQPPRDAQGPQAPRSPDARAVDRALRRLVLARQRRDAEIAAQLKIARATEGYRADGYASLEEYAADVFDFTPARLYGLLKLDRTLRSLPAARAAFLSGRLTLKPTLALDGVAAPWSETAWIRRAEEVTLRRLEDEISFWRHLKETRPEVWNLLGGGPLPAGLVLIPGHPPRLPAPARSARLSSAAGGDGARGSPITAAAFLRALEADAALAPLPPRITSIRMAVEPQVHQAWKETADYCRSVTRSDLKAWETLALVLREFWRVWDNNETRRQRRENPTLERDGWRCAAPACRSIGTGNLHEHHVEFRSMGGALRDPSNRISLCVGHHLGLVHEGKIVCTGRAPDALRWEMGTEPGREPFQVYVGQEEKLGAERPLERPAPVSPISARG